MSIVAPVLATAGAAALTFFKPSSRRKFDKIVAPCILTEHHVDQYVITDHPTEYGAQISDHMYALPRRVDVEIIYSQSSATILQTLAATATFGLSNKKIELKDYYQKFIALQQTKQPFTIVTGKRIYNACMVIESIEEVTAPETENLLRLMIRCREIQIVYTSTTPNSANMSNPAVTGSPIQSGGLTTYPLEPSSLVSTQLSNASGVNYAPGVAPH